MIIRRRGFSLLLECLIGLALFATAILMTMSLYPVADRSLGQARDLATASQLAHRVMERTLAQPYASVLPVAPDPTTVLQTQDSHSGNAVSVKYTYQVDITNPTAPSQLKIVQVTVSWDHGALHRDFKLQSAKCPF